MQVSRLHRIMMVLLAGFAMYGWGVCEIKAKTMDEAAEAQSSGRPELCIRTGHVGLISSVAFSPDGRLALSGGAPNTVKLWEISSGRLIRTFIGHSGEVDSVAVSPNGRLALSGSSYDSMKLWDISSGKEIRSFDGHSRGVSAVAFSPDGELALSGSHDKTLNLWSVSTGKEVRSFAGHADEVLSVAFSADGRYVLSGSGDKTAVLWDVSSGKALRSFIGHTDRVRSVCFFPGGRYVLSGGMDKTVRMWDSSTGGEVRRFVGHTDQVLSVACSSDGRYVLSGGSDSTARLWSAADGEELRTFAGRSPASAVGISPDGRYALVGGWTVLRLWELSSGEHLRAMYGGAGEVYAVAFSSDGRRALCGAYSTVNNLVLWDLADGDGARSIAGHSEPVYSVAFSPDGRYALSGGYDTTVRLWELSTGEEIRRFKGHSKYVYAVAFSPDGQFALSGGMGGVVKLWDVAAGREVWTHKGLGTVKSVAFSRDGRHALSGAGTAGEMTLREAASGREVMVFKGQLVSLVAMSPDGRHALSDSMAGNSLKLWDVQTGEEIRSFTGHSGSVNALAFSPDGRYVLSGSDDKTIRMWEASTGKEVWTFIGHTSSVESVAFSPDGRFVLSGSRDMTCMLWDTATGRWAARLFSFGDGAWAVVDPDGRYDASDPGDLPSLSWIMPDDPLTPIPVEVFMKEYYEPRLLARIAAGERFKPVKPLWSLNRAQPVVKITRVESEQDDAGTVCVSVEVSGARKDLLREGKTIEQETGVYDLRLFRNGQLVGYAPAAGGEVAPDLRAKPGVVTFHNIKLPRHKDGREVEFSAYAFNVDGVKSATHKEACSISLPVPAGKGRAYLVSIGINAHENPSWDLRYAANDARAVLRVLSTSLAKGRYDYGEIVPILLVSDFQKQTARKRDTEDSLDTEKASAGSPVTKARIRGIFDLLAGREVDRAIMESIPNGSLIKPATPDDLLLVSFSGHGYADMNGNFYLFPYDIGGGRDRAITDEVLRHTVSSEELSLWLRDVDAGDMLMIIDACSSAASVEGAEGKGFKPGPMGSRGLGQLAYDKGMRILTASQAEDVAIESDLIGHGLLSYALVREGIEARLADSRPKDGAITAGEWLRYGRARVPVLYGQILAGKTGEVGGSEAGKGQVIALDLQDWEEPKDEPRLQQPGLFDFARNRSAASDIVIAVHPE